MFETKGRGVGREGIGTRRERGGVVQKLLWINDMKYE